MITMLGHPKAKQDRRRVRGVIVAVILCVLFSLAALGLAIAIIVDSGHVPLVKSEPAELYPHSVWRK